MKRKFLISLLSVACASCCAIGLAACADKPGTTDGEYIPPDPADGPTYQRPERPGDTLLEIALTNDGTYTVLGLGDETNTDIVIPGKIGDIPVSSIDKDAFNAQTNLTGIKIEEGVTYIGENAFNGCIGLEYIKLPASVTSVGINAFRNCAGLRTVDLSENLMNISNGMFRGCSGLEKIAIPDSVTSIGDTAFAECSSLTGIEIGDNVLTVGERAFSGCSSIEKVTLGNSVAELGDETFNNCPSLNTLVIPDSVEYIGSRLLVGCYNIKNLTIPFVGSHRFIVQKDLPFDEQMEEAKDYAYFAYLFGAGNRYESEEHTSMLSGITVTINGVTDEAPLCSMSFYNVRGVSMVIINGTTTAVQEDTFMSTDPGKTIDFVIPKTVTRLGDRAFYGTDVGKIYYGGTLIEWNKVNLGVANMRTFSYSAGIGYSEEYMPGCWHWVDGKPEMWVKK